MEEVQQQIELVSREITHINSILANPLNAWNELSESTKEVFPPATWWATAGSDFQERLTSLQKEKATLQERHNLILKKQLSSNEVEFTLREEKADLQKRITILQKESATLQERQTLILQQQLNSDKENAALQERISTLQKENAAFQKGQSSNQVVLTLEEYLTKSIPPTPSYQNIPDSSSTDVKGQWTPSLISWDNFFVQVKNWISTIGFENPEKKLLPPRWFERVISTEVSTLHPFVFDNILEPVVKPFKHLEVSLFSGGSFKEEPNFIFYGSGKLLSFGDVKGFWTLPSESDLIAQYESNSNVKGAVNQIYSNLLFYHLNSAVLTNYEMTWFFERRIEKNREEKLYISPGVAFNMQAPTLFQCMAYFLTVIAVNDAFQSPSLRQKLTQECFVSPFEQEISHRDLDFGEVIGIGHFGTVYLTDSGLTALKTLDISKRPHLVDEFIEEISIYWKLKPLQGKVIPTFRYCGIAVGLLFVFGMDYVGKVPTKLNSDQKEKLLLGLSEIHSYGILHGDIRVENIVVDSLGNPYIIHFSFSSCDNNADKQKEEFLLLQKLLDSL